MHFSQNYGDFEGKDVEKKFVSLYNLVAGLNM